MAFRPALLSDAGAIRDLLVRSELQAEGLESLPARFFLAENEDGIAGVAGLEICGTDGLLRSVAVLREGEAEASADNWSIRLSTKPGGSASIPCSC